MNMQTDQNNFTIKHTEPDPIDVHVGQRIRDRRKVLKVTQPRLARSVGVTYQQIQKYEKGKNKIGSSRLLKIAVALGVSVDHFFKGAEVFLPNLTEEIQRDESLTASGSQDDIIKIKTKIKMLGQNLESQAVIVKALKNASDEAENIYFWTQEKLRTLSEKYQKWEKCDQSSKADSTSEK